MSRKKGLFEFSGNFDPLIDSALDARLIVDEIASLTDSDYWKASDGLVYTYKGMIVAVVDDPDSENNGIYVLLDDDYQDINNWSKSGSGGVSTGGGSASASIESFLELDDVPNSYIGKAGYVTIVNSSEDGLDFIPFIGGPSGSFDFDSLSASFYTNPEPTPDKVGGIEANTTFTMKSMSEMWDMLLYPDANPTITGPSVAFTSNAKALEEIGQTLTINFTATFNQGSINPQYGASASERSGLPNTYTYTGPGLPPTVVSSSLSDSQSVTPHVVTAGTTNQKWTVTVDYDESSVQPKTRKGDDFGSPLGAGTTTQKSIEIEGVYAYYATTSDINTLIKQTLSKSPLSIEMVAGKNQRFDIHSSLSITKIEQYNTNSGKWETIDTSSFTKNMNGSETYGVFTYDTYTAQATIGTRSLKVYVS